MTGVQTCALPISEINAICDALCKRYLADLSAVQDNALWQKRRAAAWDLLNNYTDTPLGQPPWRTESLYQSPDIITDSKPDFSAPIEYEIPVTASLPATDSNTVVLAEKKPAVFDIAEEGHSSVLPYEAVSPEINKPDPTFNQYAWKPHEPGRLERTLATLSGWHAMAVPFLMQNIGWFIGVFCFIAGSMFLVS